MRCLWRTGRHLRVKKNLRVKSYRNDCLQILEISVEYMLIKTKNIKLKKHKLNFFFRLL